jgi:hypothetical protein
VLDPAKFRISGYDDRVHAYRGRHRESIRIGNRELGFDLGRVKNITEGVAYSLDWQCVEAAEKIVS